MILFARIGSGMQEIFWVIDKTLGGRPGPNNTPWSESELAEGGVRAVLSVNDGEDVDSASLRRYGIDYCCVPMSSNAPPSDGDLEYCLRALDAAFHFAEGQARAGRPLIVHCHAGKDRTGLFYSYYLCRKFGMTPHQAISRVKEVRPIALTAEGWDVFAIEVLEAAFSTED